VADLKNRSYALGVLVSLGTTRERLAQVFAFQIFLMSSVTTLLGGLLGCAQRLLSVTAF
jgi:predicted lysophospholipase L1 biosynthesis ABC-type transport system permease subunit